MWRWVWKQMCGTSSSLKAAWDASKSLADNKPAKEFEAAPSRWITMKTWEGRMEELFCPIHCPAVCYQTDHTEAPQLDDYQLDCWNFSKHLTLWIVEVLLASLSLGSNFYHFCPISSKSETSAASKWPRSTCCLSDNTAAIVPLNNNVSCFQTITFAYVGFNYQSEGVAK